MALSKRTPVIDPLAARPSPPSSILSMRNVRHPTGKSKGKGKAVARKPWADGPWPLIETPSRTLNITHPALHIANELARAHNAALRGLNALYLQAPSVRQPGDVADFAFLARVWSGWVLDHHEVKESGMLPGFEAALGLEVGGLGVVLRGLVLADGVGDRGRGVIEEEDDEDEDGDGDMRDRGEEGTRDIPTLLQKIHSYAVEIHSQPTSYSPSILQTLLASLASVLVPHLHAQIPLLMRMKDLCAPTPSPSPSNPSPSSPPHLPTPDPATNLTQIFLAAETSLANRTDRFAVPPMLIRLRDAAHDGGAGLSVPAVHAVADRLSPRHAGAWRFLPCDVWGRRRELEFLGGA
ncbi:hypothetical protein F5Y05DRAFT_111832 [Hypoxylon sp. FL0543]|nr:hypothetical protein F5Y05DRAFT_111832 [Hypoxylon sp. FL0543]